MDSSIFLYSKDANLPYVTDASKMLVRAYAILVSQGYDASGNNENTIRDDLVRQAQRLKTSGLVYMFSTEFPDLEKSSRIDIRIITPMTLESYGKGGITYECKIIGEDAYLNRNGLNSFIESKYAENMAIGGMVGFVKDGDIDDKIAKIQTKLTQHPTINTIRNLEQYSLDEDFEYSYVSDHVKLDTSEISIHHLFFDFINEPAAS
jgi:hypothetical protein